MTMSEEENQTIELKLLKYLRDNHVKEFREEFLELHPYDQASFFSEIEESDRQLLYQYLSPEEMAELFENVGLEKEQIQIYLSEMDSNYAAEMFSNMYADDAVDVLNELDKEQVARFLRIMDKDAANEIKDLLHYEEYTAGSIMTTEYIKIEANQTVRSAMYILKKEAPSAETIYYIYVVDADEKLVGVLSLRDLIISDDDTMISDIMYERVVSVSVSTDQEEAARMMKDYDFLALPVVDDMDRLVGIITVDDIIDVLEEEASEDYSKFAAITDVDILDRSPVAAAKKRLPWLIILLFLGMMTASLIGIFEATLEKVAVLAIFIPLIAGMAGNSGTQALAVAVRGISTGEIQKETVQKLIAREAGTGFITGLTCGLIVSILVSIWQNNISLGILVGISIAGSLFVATLAGTLVPLIMHKFKIDPAVASGPFITTINDLISILIYFSLASILVL
ncbi:MAG TPA: magnesium transporter [Bacillus sp. (in: firmicutes)]|uniref:magnesium transporter n=1 Tax=Bacillus litorisediminis TaxID=2922713 RepID=UPI001FAE3582|nr:magnesium transporter [Bacillus litorisediminis]HWO77523.1 magnesium transporter [Bacillus sp. (in: firmicutes)]